MKFFQSTRIKLLLVLGIAATIWIPFHLKKKRDRQINRVECSLNISQLPSSLEILDSDFDSFFNDVTTAEFLIPKSAREEILSGRDWKNLPTNTFSPPEENPVEFWMWQRLNDKVQLWIYEEQSKLRVLVSRVQFYETGLEFSEDDNVSGSLPYPNESVINLGKKDSKTGDTKKEGG